METVRKIIDRKGGLEALKASHIKLLNPPYMPLVVEYVGQGPRGLPLVSVAHYFEQNGDMMRDPEIVFEIPPGGPWEPVSIQQDPVGVYQRAVFLDEGGRLMVRPVLVRSIKALARMWDRNLKAQGFLEAAGK